MTQFQNHRQHWIFPFSVGVTNVQHVASLSLRFILKKLMNSVQRFHVAPVAPKHSIPTLKNKNKSLLYCQFRLCITTALFRAAAKADAGKARTPLLKSLEVIFMKTKTKTEIISTRVTPEQREIIEEKAYSSYRMPSMYLRDCALDKKIVVVKGIDEAANELRKIGNNLNQLTRAVNSGYCYEVDLRETREEVARLWQLLNSLTQEVR